MNRWRQKHPDHAAAKAPHEDDSGSTDAELTVAAESVYDTAAQHRAGVISKDKAAKVRRKGARRG